jgi:hypothetical protein
MSIKQNKQRQGEEWDEQQKGKKQRQSKGELRYVQLGTVVAKSSISPRRNVVSLIDRVTPGNVFYAHVHE